MKQDPAIAFMVGMGIGWCLIGIFVLADWIVKIIRRKR